MAAGLSLASYLLLPDVFADIRAYWGLRALACVLLPAALLRIYLLLAPPKQQADLAQMPRPLRAERSALLCRRCEDKRGCWGWLPAKGRRSNIFLAASLLLGVTAAGLTLKITLPAALSAYEIVEGILLAIYALMIILIMSALAWAKRP